MLVKQFSGYLPEHSVRDKTLVTFLYTFLPKHPLFLTDFNSFAVEADRLLRCVSY